MRKTLLLITALVLAVTSCSAGASTDGKSGNDSVTVKEQNNKTEMEIQQPSTENVMVDITTSLGDIRVMLYGDTPKHRDNFVKLVNDGFYNGTLFHRVINEFMIQAGDPESKNAPSGKMLGSGGPGYNVDAEIVYPVRFHKRGALAAARQADQVNPERRSSGSQFYIVTGKVYNDSQLRQMEGQLLNRQKQSVFNRLAGERRDQIMELRRNRDQAGLQNLQEELISIMEAEVAQNPMKFTPEQRQAYSTVGGTPHLDGDYTVFGEIVSGMDVVERIEKAATNAQDRPNEDIKIISAKIVK